MSNQVHVFYEGRVQGIGFRFTVERVAKELGVCGWVRNLGDGRVELWAEGKEGLLKELLGQIKSYFLQYIKNTEENWQQGVSSFQDFRVRF